ncbi:hypothetical protein BAR24_10615 [Gluconobacter oxydans]|nr:hypothetical protein BAR24_10615 [Gluconobacter oxydans]
MAVICGAVLLVLVFRVLLPPNHASDAMMIMKALRKSVNALTRASTRHLPNPEQWQGDQIQKLSRLAIKLSFLDQAFSLVSLGKLILDLRQKPGNPLEERAVQMFLYDTVSRSQMISYESLGNSGLASNIDQIKFILKHIGNK